MKGSIFLIIAFIATCFANTEKLILEARGDNIKDLCGIDSNDPILTPPYTKIQESLIPHSENIEGTPHRYHLKGLNDGSNYEVRISYPAITPADFKLKTLRACKSKDTTLSYILEVSAIYTGVSHIKGKELQPVTYDLVLENLYAGVFFYQVYKIVIAIASVICLGQFVLIPYVKQLITAKDTGYRI